MTAPAPTPPPPAPPPPPSPPPLCVRCGSFDLRGPAADLGFPLCTACWEWRPIEAVRKPVRLNRLGRIALVPLGIGLGFVLAARMGGVSLTALPTWVVGLVLGLVLLALLVALGLLVYSFVYRFYFLAVWRRRTIGLLGFEPERLREGHEVASVRMAAHIDGPAPVTDAAQRLLEVAILATSKRGVLLYGLVLERLALPWEALEIAPSERPRHCVRLSPREGAPAGAATCPAPHHFVFEYAVPRLLVATPKRVRGLLADLQLEQARAREAGRG